MITDPIFYCPEWFIFWIGVDNLMQGMDQSKSLEKMRLEPLSLKEIIDYNLCEYLSGVLETNISGVKAATRSDKFILF